MGLISRVSSRTYRNMTDVNGNDQISAETAQEMQDINSLLGTIESTLEKYEQKVKDFDKKVKDMVQQAIEEDDQLFEIVEAGSDEDAKMQPASESKSESETGLR